MFHPIESFIFSHDGKTYLAEVYPDECGEAPWEKWNVHGVVSGWDTRSKRPGECILSGKYARGSCLFYDVQETMKKARADGWGLSEPALAKLCESLGRPATRGEVIAAAVRADFELLRGWCDGEWHYVGICVRALGDDGTVIGEPFDHALWGIESVDAAYIREVAAELASEIE